MTSFSLLLLKCVFQTPDCFFDVSGDTRPSLFLTTLFNSSIDGCYGYVIDRLVILFAEIIFVNVLVVQLNSSNHGGYLLILHDVVETIGNDCDQKVKHHNDHDDKLEDPNDPDGGDIGLSLPLVTLSIPSNPVVIARRLKITDGGS